MDRPVLENTKGTMRCLHVGQVQLTWTVLYLGNMKMKLDMTLCSIGTGQLVWPVLMDKSREIWNVLMQEKFRYDRLACTWWKLKKIWHFVIQNRYNANGLACISGRLMDHMVCHNAGKIQFRRTGLYLRKTKGNMECRLAGTLQLLWTGLLFRKPPVEHHMLGTV